MSAPKRIAFVGNPNCGKSTLFNRLTGLTQKTSNLPGTTVEAFTGHVIINGEKTEIIDLPGIYSLYTQSDDERLVVQHLAGIGEEKPEALLLVIDASNLRRNLLLYSQVAELGIPAVCVLTLSDSAKRRGVRIDADALSEELGIPCLFFNPRREKNIEPVKQLLTSFAQPKLIGQETQLSERL
ncbi:MAG: GTP-binding protein, partial [Sphingomonadales bacterium]|nr:GTP-binding protein [Sphingomonadales bacterium]